MSLSEKEIKQMLPPEGKAIVYIVRSKRTGGLIKFKTFCNDELIGVTKAKKFLYLILDPGRYQILSKAENKDYLDIDVEANRTYFIAQKVRVGAVKARVKMYILDEEEGRKRLNLCKLPKK